MFSEIKPIVNENIRQAILDGDLNRKVMPGDHVVTAEERIRVVFKYDLNKRKLKSKISRLFANAFANRVTKKKFAPFITIEGIEHAMALKGTAYILTGNHYSPFDSLITRYMLLKTKRKNKQKIVVNESNLFMAGKLGTLVRALDVLPYAQDKDYLTKILNPALERLIKQKAVILIYPEQEMWLDYCGTRPLKPGAYHYSSKFNIPLLPTFTSFYEDSKGQMHYTLHIGAPLFPDPKKTLSENKSVLLAADDAFKQAAASHCHR